MSTLINGCGHLWFLPMLFLCYLGGWLLERIPFADGWKMTLLLFANVFFFLIYFIPVPPAISRAITYLFYFYGGFVVYKYADFIKGHISPKQVTWGWLVFAFFFIVFYLIKEKGEVAIYTDTLRQVLALSGRNFAQLLYASAGTLAFYLSVILYVRDHHVTCRLTKLVACSFGIYLFQEFILMGLYYHTGFPKQVGPYWLPWLGFVIAVLLSFILTLLLLKTIIGRFLFG